MAETKKNSDGEGNQPKGKNIVDVLWDAFRSPRLALFLLIAISAAAIIGTLIPQNPSPQQLQSYSESARKIMDFFNLFDLYHSRWFQGLLALLCVNLFICTLDRLPHAWEQIKNEKVTVGRGEPELLKLSKGFDFEGSVEEATEKVRKVLRSHRGRIFEENHGDNRLFLLNMGRWSRLGVHVLHLSIIVIVLGAIVGNLFGFRGRVAIPEGRTVDSFSRQWKGDNFEQPLGFTVKCNSFTFTIDPATGMPGNYTSKLEIYEEGKKVAEPTVMVNHPFYHRGIGFYQSEYRLLGTESVTVEVRKDDGSIAGEVTVLSSGEGAEVPGGGVMKLLDVMPDMENQTIAGALVELDAGDAGTVMLELYPEQPARIGTGTNSPHRLFKGFPNFDKMNSQGKDRYYQLLDIVDSKAEIVIRSMADERELGRVTLSEGESAVVEKSLKIRVVELSDNFDVHGKLDKMALIEEFTDSAGNAGEKLGGFQYFFKSSDGLYATILDVNHDPGVPLVWAGFILMFAGLWMTFFMSHRKVWVKVTPGRISVGGLANRNQQAFEKEFSEIVKDFSVI